MADYFNAPPNLAVTLPKSRAAYSDRSAWVMSEMSALAYLYFEGENPFKGVLNAIKIAAAATGWIGYKSNRAKLAAERFRDLEVAIKKYIDHRLGEGDPNPPGLQELKDALNIACFKLVRTFNEGDTQAFLAQRDEDKVAVLAFRGTESNSLKDIKTDLNIRFYKGSNGAKVHSGFQSAYNQVKRDVEDAVDKLPNDYSLYITGHSLGGALAVIAAKNLERDSLAACYTFGSPRVGNEEFGEGIRAPIYRIVNAADGVPRVPPFLMKGYRHQGDMRYLTACDDDVSKLKVIPNLNIIIRLYRLVQRIRSKGFASLGRDHAINEYRKKLQFYATERNQ